MTDFTHVAGVDGCRSGWICVMRALDEEKWALFHATGFAALLESLPPGTAIAVDMPIGLPDRTGHGGRGPESLVRQLLGDRQSTVFSIPSRSAVHAECGPFATKSEALDAHARASAVARETSDPPRAISVQAFFIFPKIREVDACIRSDTGLTARIIESHPELAFRALNNGRPVPVPKKTGGRINPPGMETRKGLLARSGFEESFLGSPLPAGAGLDDFLDACAVATVAVRFAGGTARPFPDPPGQDAFGIPIAIWC